MPQENWAKCDKFSSTPKSNSLLDIFTFSCRVGNYDAVLQVRSYSYLKNNKIDSIYEDPTNLELDRQSQFKRLQLELIFHKNVIRLAMN